MYRKAAELSFDRGDIMKECIVEMPSYTYAKKAEKLLNSRGIRAEEKRRSTGCGYMLKIYADCRSSLNILDKFGVHYFLREKSEAP